MPPVTSAITLNVHPSRDELHEELHSRPSPLVETPCTISHIAVQIGAEERAAEREYLGELCTRFDTNPPREGASCFYQTFGGFELRWEKHTEFSTYTFIQRVLGDPLRQAGALTRVPGDWLAKMPGKVTTALHLAFRCAEGPIDPAELDRYFEKQPLRGGVVRQGTAYLYSSFRLHSDGFGRIVLQARDLTPLQAGRLVQRVLEVETYRLMALLALPVARKIAPDVRTTERELARITQELTHAEEETDQRALLDELSKLAARVERHRSDTTYRFAATNAYYDLVEERIQELGEGKIPGLQSIRVFIERRLAPGIRTCNAVRDRLEGLSGRISQASELLRARVELSIQGQNRELLTSMNRRSEVQLRLQQAVEGLSVVAMTYYLMGLLGYLYEGLAWTGLA
ncbi:MAG: DUF3422 domain-containing protein, partial [Deltaproteobacteria bacterium]|nr:DUF3422 domain-containing protein [Deltaproteobacteria bacterium]